MRLRRLVETRILNTDRPLADLIDEFSAANRDAVAISDPGWDEDVGGVEWLRPNRARLEALRIDMTPHDRFAVVPADDGIPTDDHARHGMALLDGDNQRLSHTDCSGGINDCELHH